MSRRALVNAAGVLKRFARGDLSLYFRSVADPVEEAARRPLARVSAPTERGRIVARGSAENPANRFERLAYAEDSEFVDDAPDDGDGAAPALPTR